MNESINDKRWALVTPLGCLWSQQFHIFKHGALFEKDEADEELGLDEDYLRHVLFYVTASCLTDAEQQEYHEYQDRIMKDYIESCKGDV